MFSILEGLNVYDIKLKLKNKLTKKFIFILGKKKNSQIIINIFLFNKYKRVPYYKNIIF